MGQPPIDTSDCALAAVKVCSRLVDGKPRHFYVVAKAAERGETLMGTSWVVFSIVYPHDAIVFWCQKLCHGSG